MFWVTQRFTPAPSAPTITGMDMNSADLLTVFAGVLRKLKLNELVTLRERFIELGKDPATVAAIEREIAGRTDKGNA